MKIKCIKTEFRSTKTSEEPMVVYWRPYIKDCYFSPTAYRGEMDINSRLREFLAKVDNLPMTSMAMGPVCVEEYDTSLHNRKQSIGYVDHVTKINPDGISKRELAYHTPPMMLRGKPLPEIEVTTYPFSNRVGLWWKACYGHTLSGATCKRLHEEFKGALIKGLTDALTFERLKTHYKEAAIESTIAHYDEVIGKAQTARRTLFEVYCKK